MPVKEHPLPMSGPMVRAMLANRKTQTRRVASEVMAFLDFARKDFPRYPLDELEMDNGTAIIRLQDRVDDQGEYRFPCPYGKPGEIVWVREATYKGRWHTRTDAAHYKADDQAVWDVTQPCEWFGVRDWRPSIFMPRAWCRLRRRIKNVRLEPVQKISDADVMAEGFIALNPGETRGKITNRLGLTMYGLAEWYSPDFACGMDPLQWSNVPFVAFARLWDQLNANRGYPFSSDDGHGPWVWAIDMEYITPPE